MIRRASRRVDWVELALPPLFVALAAGLFGYRHFRLAHDPSLDETRFYAARFGPSHDSQNVEEWLIRDFFKDRRGGFFLDVGSGHPQQFSNTFYLEKSLGWRGIAVDPIVEFEPDYAALRPATAFRPFFVSDKSDESAKLYVLSLKESPVSSGVRAHTERTGGSSTSRTVPTITLNDLLEREGVTSIDFMSMDIELWEPKALAGFDIDRFRPALVCIEAAREVRQHILDYFNAHRYVVIGDYLRADPVNLWFKVVP